MSAIFKALEEVYQAFLHTIRQNTWSSLALCGLAGFGVFIWLTATNANVYYAGDTKIWISGSEWLKDCILKLDSGSCRKVSYFPLWNNVISLILSNFIGDQMFLWYYLNIISYIIYLLIIFFTIRNLNLWWRFCITYSVILSPLLFQVNSTGTEIQQGLLLTVALLSLQGRILLVSSVLILLSIITKETFTLFWSAILISVLYKDFVNIKKDLQRQIYNGNYSNLSVNAIKYFLHSLLKFIGTDKKAISLIIGVSIGSLLNLGFNYIRSHQFRSPYFPQNTLFPVDLYHTVLNLKWSLISPNGGIMFAYSLLISVILCYLLSNRRVRDFAFLKLYKKYKTYHNTVDLNTARSSSQELIVVISILLLSGLVTTSMWWVAFGWDTWGHRLIVPYIMPTIVLTNLVIQKYMEFCTKYEEINKNIILNLHENSHKITLITYSVGILAVILVICGFAYNLATVQVVYRKNRDIFGESLYSQPWCQKMASDDRGITPYLWQCTVERFKYIPILYHPPDLFGFEGKKLLSIALISLYINIILIPLRPVENRIMVHQTRGG